MSGYTTCPVYTCEQCFKSYSVKSNMMRHKRNCGSTITKFSCDICDKQFTRKDKLKGHKTLFHEHDRDNLTCKNCQQKLLNFHEYSRHVIKCKRRKIKDSTVQNDTLSKDNYTCEKCSKSFSNIEPFIVHSTLCSLEKDDNSNVNDSQIGGGKDNKKIDRPLKSPRKRKKKTRPREASNKAQNGYVQEFDFKPEGDQGMDPMFFMILHQSEVIDILNSEIDEKKCIKWALCIHAKYGKTGPDGSRSYTDPYFQTKMTSCTQTDDPAYQYAKAINHLFRRIDNFEGESSNLEFETIINMKLSVTKFQPFEASSFIPLPDTLSHKRSILNIRNLNDDLCFVYSILAHLHPSPNKWKDLPSEYEQYLEELDLTGFSFPMPFKDIPRFERINRLCINLYGYEKKTIYPIRVSDNTGVTKERHIDLMYLTSDTDEEDDNDLNSSFDDIDNTDEMFVQTHYCLITSMSGLLWKKRGNHSKHVCRKCLWCYSSEARLEAHKPYCYDKAQTVLMPSEDKATRNFGLGKLIHTVEMPFVIYADFETVLEPLPEQSDDQREIKKIHKHIPCGYGYKIVSRNEKYTKPLKVYSGEDAAEHFMESLLKDYEEIKEILNNPIPLQLTDEDRALMDSTSTCYLCKKAFEREDKKVFDHDHLDGRLRGVCHNACNLHYKERKEIPVVLHNASKYDSKLILQASNKFSDRKIRCIPQNIEHFLMFSIDDLIFLDSFKFLSTSLQTLTDNLLKKGLDKFKHLGSHFPEHLNLLTKKLPYFYEYITDFSKLDETTCPSRDKFYSSLTEETITEKDHAFVEKLWEVFDIKSIREFMHLYLSVDVLALTDTMEEFRRMTREFYGLECFSYFSLPGLASDACLKMTGVSIDLLTDIDKYLMLEGAVRGGLSVIGHRHAKANNRYMDDYDASLPESYLLYWDINNLYGCAMSDMLPKSNFNFMTEEEFAIIDWSTIDTENNLGYILEVDLIYPPHLHRLHASLPLAPTKESIPYEDFSPYHKQLLTDMGIKRKVPSGIKLFATLKDKENYVVHFATLKLYLKLGLKLGKIHRVLSFEQSKWMKPFIDFNTERRKEATDDFSKDFWKLCTNATYGKQLQNVRKYERVELVVNKQRLTKYTNKPNFKYFKIYSEDLVAIKMEKLSVTLNQNVATGFTVLDHAKRKLYSFHYEVMLEQYGDKLKLLMSDTDSLFYEISNPVDRPISDFNPYVFMKRHLDLFDTSNFPQEHFLHSMTGHKILGRMKDEAEGKIIIEFLGIRAKNYSFIFEQSPGELKEKKTAKGVKKTYVRKHMTHAMYKDCLFKKKQTKATFHLIRSYSNQLYTIRTTKIALSPLDDKRYLLDDGITSVPYGFQG